MVNYNCPANTWKSHHHFEWDAISSHQIWLDIFDIQMMRVADHVTRTSLFIRMTIGKTVLFFPLKIVARAWAYVLGILKHTNYQVMINDRKKTKPDHRETLVQLQKRRLYLLCCYKLHTNWLRPIFNFYQSKKKYQPCRWLIECFVNVEL